MIIFLINDSNTRKMGWKVSGGNAEPVGHMGILKYALQHRGRLTLESWMAARAEMAALFPLPVSVQSGWASMIKNGKRQAVGLHEAERLMERFVPLWPIIESH